MHNKHIIVIKALLEEVELMNGVRWRDPPPLREKGSKWKSLIIMPTDQQQYTNKLSSVHFVTSVKHLDSMGVHYLHSVLN